MKNKNDNVLRFYLLATTLKNKIRQGLIYWNVTAPRRESIAEHVYDTCMLAISIDSEYNLNINISKVLTMIIIHELEEVMIGDITPFDNVTEKEKLDIGKKAVLDILSTLEKKDEYIDLTDEFNAKETREAQFAYLCDKLDFLLQMKIYTDKGFIKLDKNLDTPVYNSEKIKNMIAQGVSSPNDIFYMYDINKFKNSPEFKSLLDYAYNLNLNELLESYLNQSK